MLCKITTLKTLFFLEIDNKICLQPQTIFSYKNAAADDAEFFYDIQALEIYIEQGLKKFISTYEEKGIQSAAFPILGGQNGGLNENNVIKIMYSYLDNLPIDIEIYQYDPRANDNMFQEFKNLLLTSNIDELAQATKIGKNYLKILIDEISKNNNLCQVSQLITIKGIGDVTLEKIFKYKNRYCITNKIVYCSKEQIIQTPTRATYMRGGTSKGKF